MFQNQQQENKNRVLISAKYLFSSDTTLNGDQIWLIKESTTWQLLK